MRTVPEIDAEMASLREQREALHARLRQLARERDAQILIAERDKIDQAIAQVIKPTGVESGERGMGDA